jgi:hypothetical protein
LRISTLLVFLHKILFNECCLLRDVGGELLSESEAQEALLRVVEEAESTEETSAARETLTTLSTVEASSMQFRLVSEEGGQVGCEFIGVYRPL